jgi:hypothetical protein
MAAKLCAAAEDSIQHAAGTAEGVMPSDAVLARQQGALGFPCVHPMLPFKLPPFKLEVK